MEVPQQCYTCKHPFILSKTQTISSKANLDLYIGDDFNQNWLNLYCQDLLKNLLNNAMLLESIDCRLKVEQKNVKRFSLHHEEKIYNKNYCSLPIHSFLLNITSGMCGKNSLVTRSYVKSPHYCCKLIQGNKQGESRNFSQLI